MKAEITVTRTPYNVEQSVTVSCELDRDGDVFAVAVETLCEEAEVFDPTLMGYVRRIKGVYLCEEGKPFELTDEEIEEAKKAIASNQAAFDKSNLVRESFNPSELCSPFSGKPIGHFPLAGLSPSNNLPNK